jgi:hypothetical protein
MLEEERNIVHTGKGRKANWIGHILCRNCILKGVIEGTVEGRVEVTGRRGRRRMQMLGDVKRKRGYRKLKEDTLVRTVCRTGVGRCYMSFVRQITE